MSVGFAGTGDLSPAVVLERMRQRVFGTGATRLSGESLLALPRSVRPELAGAGMSFAHVNDFLAFHDEAFVLNAYRHILGREPDPGGWVHYLEHLRSAQFDKIEILGRMRLSAEGRRLRRQVRGLMPLVAVRAVLRTPVLGPVLQWLYALARLPSRLRAVDRMQAYLLAQLQQSAHAHDSLSAAAEEAINLTRRAIAELRSSAASQEMIENIDLRVDELGGDIRRLAEFSSQFDSLRLHYDSLHEAVDGLVANARKAAPDPALNRLEAEYRKAMVDDPQTRRRRLLAHLDRIDLDGSDGRQLRVLDIACGAGEWMDLMVGFGADATGLEANAILCEEGRSSGLDILAGDELASIQRLDSGEFDLVTVFQLPGQRTTLRLAALMEHAARVLRAGGHLIIDPCQLSVPAMDSPLLTWATARQLAWMAERTGLTITGKAPTLSSADGWPILARKPC